MAACLTAEIVEDFLDRRLDDESSAAVAQHLSGCATCSELELALASDRELVLELREHLASGGGSARLATIRPAIPGYEIHDEIHRGGQGVVYAATQASTGRRAAVKVLLSGPRATRQERDRFEREVSLAASLRHPGIVTVFDGGATAEGWNWLAMELVDGVPLHRFLAERRPAIAEALSLFREICDAVRHAHLKGVIHRDLKPPNVLVDAAGHSRVLDFGLAKQMVPAGDASGGATASGEFVGTLHWAAPEQLEGDPGLIDVRTDVHALGLIFFHLLTGQHPWPKDVGLAELMRTIGQVDPPPPSTLARGIDSDLDAIALKALAKEPERRYASAGELLRDVERHARGEPVDARGPDRWYAFRKAVRRHRVLVGAGAAVVLGLSAATIVSLVYRAESERSLTDARKAGALALAEAEKSAEAVALMRKAIESGRSLRKGKAMTMVDFLDDAARELDAHLPRHPRAEAILRTTLGFTYGQLGLGQKAVDQLRKGTALHEKTAGPDDAERLSAALELARTLHLVGAAPKDESALFEDVIARATRVHGPADALVLRARLERAVFWASTGKMAEAIADAEDVVATLAARGESGSALRVRATQVLAASLGAAGRLGDAEKVIRAGLELKLDDPDRVGLLVLLLQNLLAARQKLPDVIEAGNQALALADQVYPEDHPIVAHLRLNLGSAHYFANQNVEAEQLFRKLLAGQARAPTIEPRDLQHVKSSLGQILSERGELAEAEKLFREAIAITGESVGPRLAFNARRALASMLFRAKRLADAEAVAREMLRSVPEKLDGNASAIDAIEMLARICVAADELDEAASLYARIAPVTFAPVPGFSRPVILERYAEVLRHLGKADESAAVAEQARALRVAESRAASTRPAR